MNTASNIAPHILALSTFLSITWGIYLGYTFYDYRRVRRQDTRRSADSVKSLRRFMVALSLWLICFAYVFRTGAVLIGLGEEPIGQIVFFALVGTNVVSSLFAVATLRYDG